MKGAPAEVPIVITDPKRARVDLGDAYDSAREAEQAHDQIHGILSALLATLENEKLDDPRPFIDVPLALDEELARPRW